MSYTIGTAAKATGKAKSTISRDIKNGRISAEKQPDGSYLIDPSELHRVYPLNVDEYAKHGIAHLAEPAGEEPQATLYCRSLSPLGGGKVACAGFRALKGQEEEGYPK